VLSGSRELDSLGSKEIFSAVVSLKCFDNMDILNLLYYYDVDTQLIDIVDLLTQNLHQFKDVMFLSCMEYELCDMCEDIVSNFDTYTLEPYREAAQE
jgi:hypothetical protein